MPTYRSDARDCRFVIPIEDCHGSIDFYRERLTHHRLAVWRECRSSLRALIHSAGFILRTSNMFELSAKWPQPEPAPIVPKNDKTMNNAARLALRQKNSLGSLFLFWLLLTQTTTSPQAKGIKSAAAAKKARPGSDKLSTCLVAVTSQEIPCVATIWPLVSRTRLGARSAIAVSIFSSPGDLGNLGLSFGE
jgi:hypothetical protein